MTLFASFYLTLKSCKNVPKNYFVFSSTGMKLILHILVLFNGMFALYSHEDFGETPEHGPRRQTRLVYGQQVFKEDQNYYPSTGYQATIISSHYCNEGLLRILQVVLANHPGVYDPTVDWKVSIEHVRNMIFTHCPIDKSRAYCGGAAITEYAVQTACHCIARFDTRETQGFGVPKVFNAWEDLVFLFVGALQFEKGNTPYVSKNFLIHQNCKHVANMSISHNMGIVVLRYRLQQGARIAAPTTMQEMTKNWYYVIGKQAVCLVVGWGSVNFEGRDVYGLPSFDLRKSWRVMRSYVYCYMTHRSILDFLFKLKLHKTTYKDIQTWSCSTDFGKLKSALGHGDSGSPVACEHGWYFGVTNWGVVAYNTGVNSSFTISTDSDLVYAFYENSWNYRPSFNQYIHDLGEREIAPTFRPDARSGRNAHGKKYAHTDNPGLDIASQSGCQRGHLVRYSLLPFTSFATFLLRIVNYI